MKSIITEQEKKRILTLYGIINEQTPLISPETESRRIEREKLEYPNYCKYPKFTREPASTKVHGGASGNDLFIDGHCLYAQPEEGSIDFKTSGIWLPNTGDTRIGFWNQEKRERFYKEYKDYLDKSALVKPKMSYEDIKEQVDKLYIDGLVHSFKIDDVLYVPAKTYAYEYFKIAFAGFYVAGQPISDKTRYKSPEWVDERNVVERTIDKYGMAIQLSIAAISIIMAPFTAGGSLALWIEIGVELGVGLPVAWREWQRGDKVDSAFSFVTAFLPQLKLFKHKYLTGIKGEVWDSLSNYLKKAPPITDEKMFAEWLSKMDVGDRKLFNNLIDDNQHFLKKLLKEVNPNLITKQVVDDVKLAIKNNPQLGDKLKFWKSIGGLDLQRNLIAGGVSIMVNLIWGDVLNEDDAGKLDKIWMKIPERYKPEFYNNIADDPKSAQDIIKNPKLSPEELGIRDKQMDDENFAKFIELQVRKSKGANYKESDDDEVETEYEKLSDVEMDSLKNNGWILLSDLPDDSEVQGGVKFINGDEWVLPKK